ncbi:hypothetical protein [Glaciihabitans sp. UYNi722]|uniref:hypothetical protein n=1 Tax=Glaciihabitans sp. UYNi722 TaxID=3156344 RepID=UPI0033923C05
MQIEKKDAAIVPTGNDEDFPGTFDVVLSAPTLDRDGDTLTPDGWKTPLPEHITFDTDHGMSVASTVGSGVPTIDEKTGNLVVHGTYSSLPRAQETRTLVNEGHIRTTSVAFMSDKSQKDGVKVTKRELLNGAFVAIPSNREALVLSSKTVKAGARNSTGDAAKIQQIHDLALSLGAAADGGVPDDKKSLQVKSITGSLEAAQERAQDALNDAYGADAWVWLRGTLSDSLIFQISVEGSSDTETYQQSYTDDGSVVTLTGERTAVDLTEIVKPDPDEDAADSGADNVTTAAAKAAAAVTKTAPVEDADSDATNRRVAHLRALSIINAPKGK